MTNRNYNRQRVFFECIAGAIFLHSHDELSTCNSHYGTVQTNASLGWTSEFVVGQPTHSQPAPAHHDVDGSFILVFAVLDAQLFHSMSEVALLKSISGRQKCLQTGQVAGKKVCKGGTGRGAVAAEIKVEAPAESGLDCRIQCSTTGKNV
jgi:hypothetical protein